MWLCAGQRGQEEEDGERRLVTEGLLKFLKSEIVQVIKDLRKHFYSALSHHWLSELCSRELTWAAMSTPRIMTVPGGHLFDDYSSRILSTLKQPAPANRWAPRRENEGLTERPCIITAVTLVTSPTFKGLGRMSSFEFVVLGQAASSVSRQRKTLLVVKQQTSQTQIHLCLGKKIAKWIFACFGSASVWDSVLVTFLADKLPGVTNVLPLPHTSLPISRTFYYPKSTPRFGSHRGGPHASIAPTFYSVLICLPLYAALWSWRQSDCKVTSIFSTWLKICFQCPPPSSLFCSSGLSLSSQFSMDATWNIKKNTHIHTENNLLVTLFLSLKWKLLVSGLHSQSLHSLAQRPGYGFPEERWLTFPLGKSRLTW